MNCNTRHSELILIAKPGHRGERSVPSKMALKAVLILATIGSVYSHVCDRDCSCADRSFQECHEPSTATKLPVVNLEECNSLCSAWSDCAWFIFDRTGGQHLNCKMFSTGAETMAQYLSSCNRVGGPLRNEVDACLGDLPDVLCGDDRYCPGGCSSCAGDRCNDFAETVCTMTATTDITTYPTDALQCQNTLTNIGSSHEPIISYFTYDHRSWRCAGYPSGERACAFVVAAKNMDIQSCQTGTQRL